MNGYKKTTVKKTAAKKPAAKKPAAKTTAAVKAPVTKKAAVQKAAPVKKAAVKKVAVKKAAPAKKAPAKKLAVKTTAAKKPVAKKTVVKKAAPAKKAAVKKVAVKKAAPAKKAAVKKVAVKKATVDNTTFDVVYGFDMETDVGSFTPFYEGVKKGTPKLLKLLEKHGIKATFFWTGHAAENNPESVRLVRDAGHEIGNHGLYHETLGDPIFPLPNNMPILPSEVEGRLREAHRIIRKVSGVTPRSFRCPRLWGSTKVMNVLESMGYVADASFPLYFYRKPFTPYHPSSRNWTKKGQMKIVEIPNFCDLSMESNDPYQRDRDQWPLFRTEGAEALMEKAESFIKYVEERKERPVLCFYLHPWEFHPMPQGELDFGESIVKPLPFIVKNCGAEALKQLNRMTTMLKKRGGRFVTAEQIAKEM